MSTKLSSLFGDADLVEHGFIFDLFFGFASVSYLLHAVALLNHSEYSKKLPPLQAH